MVLVKKTIILGLASFCIMNSLYAQSESGREGVLNNGLSKSVVVVSGKVFDKATAKPIASAKVVIVTNNVLKEATTNAQGYFMASFSAASWFRICKITVSAQEYQKQTRFVSLPPWKSQIIANFRLNDITIPSLEISAPLEGQEIFTSPTIKISYHDYGSGINFSSLKIFANDTDLTQYTVESNSQEAVCTVPKESPLAEGAATLYAQIKDSSGNFAEDTLAVTVVSEVNYYLQMGKEALLNRNILSSHRYLAQALEAEPENPEANFYFAITRLGFFPWLMKQSYIYCRIWV